MVGKNKYVWGKKPVFRVPWRQKGNGEKARAPEPGGPGRQRSSTVPEGSVVEGHLGWYFQAPSGPRARPVWRQQVLQEPGEHPTYGPGGGGKGTALGTGQQGGPEKSGPGEVTVGPLQEDKGRGLPALLG